MKKMFLAALMLFSAGCVEGNTFYYSEYKDIPVALVFPSEYHQLIYEYPMLEMIEDANGIFHEANVYFYVSRSEVDTEYNPEYNNKRESIEDEVGYFSAKYWEDVPLYVVDKIYIQKEGEEATKSYAGLAISPGGSTCANFGLVRATTSEYQLIVAHELGHLMGLAHSTDKNNFMYPQIGHEAKMDFSQEDIVSRNSKIYYDHCVKN